jgi:hypothetical protein
MEEALGRGLEREDGIGDLKAWRRHQAAQFAHRGLQLLGCKPAVLRRSRGRSRACEDLKQVRSSLARIAASAALISDVMPTIPER